MSLLTGSLVPANGFPELLVGPQSGTFNKRERFPPMDSMVFRSGDSVAMYCHVGRENSRRRKAAVAVASGRSYWRRQAVPIGDNKPP